MAANRLAPNVVTTAHRMAPNIVMSTSAWASTPDGLQRVLLATAQGQNSNIPFTFREMRFPRGTRPHVPNTDRTEVRPSLSVEFVGAPQGNVLLHLFHDGTTKTREDMYAEQNQRNQEEAQLSAEESRFPGQTQARRQAHARMMARIEALRQDETMSIMGKQVEKWNAETEYRTFLRSQADERAGVAQQQLAAESSALYRW